MPELIQIAVNGKVASVPKGVTISVALGIAGVPCRVSVHGESRGPLCGMGICFECRAMVTQYPGS
jgi:D-hydroxyproline dehydrogenase subunit gamma